ncbi:Uncharacterized protein GBIM_21279, partial [Gryllus bimaculatus]
MADFGRHSALFLSSAELLLRLPPLLVPTLHYAALNSAIVMFVGRFRQVGRRRFAQGRPVIFYQDAVIGFEFSGRLSSGRRVMGMRMGGCVTTEIIVPEFFLWDVPDEMTLLEASTIPAAYGT